MTKYLKDLRTTISIYIYIYIYIRIYIHIPLDISPLGLQDAQDWTWLDNLEEFDMYTKIFGDEGSDDAWPLSKPLHLDNQVQICLFYLL